ncbi:MAG: polyphenol oxidase family protein [Acidobacteria bacterium]|nr:polyphenol oxidase family protein [Acidobacteriota bacterium]
MKGRTGWRDGEVGGTPVMAGTWPGVHLVFGLGPRWPGGSVEDRARDLLLALGPELAALRWCDQIHGRLMASLSAGKEHPVSGAASVGRCDGLMTGEPGIGVLVWTADCVPVLLHGGGVVAAVHAGWRGIVAGIVPAAVRRLGIEYGVPAHELRAAMGPSVGPCHYEVGQEVLDGITAACPDASAWRRGRSVDLRAAVEGQLTTAGLRPQAVERVGGCTACDARLASYRRDGERSGRQWSVAFVRP